MQSPRPSHEEPKLTTFARSHPSIVAALAGLGSVVAWFVLASLTHLTFHLMPAAAPLAGAVVVRTWASVADGRGALLVALVATILLAAAAAFAVWAAGLPTDGLAVTAATIGLGGLMAAWLLRSYIW